MDTLTVLVITLFTPIAAFLLIATAFVLIAAVRAWRTYRGVHVIQCPETRKPAAVRVDTGHAAVATVVDDTPDVRLASCSRWPERAGCDQACVPQIERDPEETRFDTILNDIFADQSCALCGCRIPGVSAVGHKPAFRGPDGKTTPCDAIAPERVYEVLESHRLVCWNCDVAETFRREHPELVIDAPAGRPQ
jgi:hypothetical protein